MLNFKSVDSFISLKNSLNIEGIFEWNIEFSGDTYWLKNGSYFVAEMNIKNYRNIDALTRLIGT